VLSKSTIWQLSGLTCNFSDIADGSEVGVI
jgi:hypothetical protein